MLQRSVISNDSCLLWNLQKPSTYNKLSSSDQRLQNRLKKEFILTMQTRLQQPRLKSMKVFLHLSWSLFEGHSRYGRKIKLPDKLTIKLNIQKLWKIVFLCFNFSDSLVSMSIVVSQHGHWVDFNNHFSFYFNVTEVKFDLWNRRNVTICSLLRTTHENKNC